MTAVDDEEPAQDPPSTGFVRFRDVVPAVLSGAEGRDRAVDDPSPAVDPVEP